MKTAKGWRQRARTSGKDLTLDDLYKYLTEIFHGTPDNPRKLGRQNIVGYIREDGTEMIRHEGPDVWGGAMPAAEWNKLMEDQAKTFLSPDKFVKSETPITSTKVTLDPGIEVTITYDGNDSQTAQ